MTPTKAHNLAIAILGSLIHYSAAKKSRYGDDIQSLSETLLRVASGEVPGIFGKTEKEARSGSQPDGIAETFEARATEIFGKK
jgi:hypothetical protein